MQTIEIIIDLKWKIEKYKSEIDLRILQGNSLQVLVIQIENTILASISHNQSNFLIND
jgi:hypothetical protein